MKTDEFNSPLMMSLRKRVAEKSGIYKLHRKLRRWTADVEKNNMCDTQVFVTTKKNLCFQLHQLTIIIFYRNKAHCIFMSLLKQIFRIILVHWLNEKQLM